LSRTSLPDVVPRAQPVIPVLVVGLSPAPNRVGAGWPPPVPDGDLFTGWLAVRDIAHFTSSRAAEPEVYRELSELKGHLSLADRVRSNPMIFFRVCGASSRVV
jgi:hypothetical protein